MTPLSAATPTLGFDHRWRQVLGGAGVLSVRTRESDSHMEGLG